MQVLVTGANGFLGSWLTRELCTRGYKVRVLLRRPNEISDLSDLQLDVRKGDITDRTSLTPALEGVDAVFHLAGVVGYSRAQRDLMEHVNVHGTKNMVDAALETGVKKFVHVSSVAAIGASFDGKKPLNESSPFNLHHLDLGYFETKRAGEEVVSHAVQTRGLDAVIVNPSTIYGAGDAKKGSRKVQLKVAQGRFRFYTSGGVSIVAVEDVVLGICAAFEKGRRGERYILAGENITIKRLFEIIAEEAGQTPPSIYLPNALVHAIGKTGDLLERLGKKGALNSENAWSSILYHWFDHSKAKEELGFNPRPAREALSASVQWMKQQGLV